MATLMRSFDWTRTPLGPSDAWPQSLRTVVRILLTSRFAMWMGWGPALTFFYNDAYREQTLAAKHPWALGRPAHEVWAEIWPQIGPRIASVLATGTATWDERLQLFLERNGYPEETYHTFSYSPLSDDGGATSGLLCVVTEETERVLGERRMAQLRDLATQLGTANTRLEIPDAIDRALAGDGRDIIFSLAYLFDPDSEILRLVSSSGLPPGHPAKLPEIAAGADHPIWPIRHAVERQDATAVGLPPGFVWPTGPWDRAPVRSLVVSMAAQGRAHAPGVLIAGLNPYRPIDDGYRSFVALFAGQLASGLASADAYESERRRAEELTAIDRAKTAFFSNVSHEFRTPLTLMLGPTEDALAREPAVLAGVDLETVHRNQMRLLKLVNTLLDFSRIEAGRVEASFAATDLAALTADLASAFRSAIDRAGLAFEVSCPPLAEAVYVDREMWEKIVLNLLSNALKFTFEGSISVSLRSSDAGLVELRVADTGVGIPETEQPRVFERFHRVEGGRARTHEGSGIGLALVQDLVRLHGGDIAVSSRVGAGTTLTVRLPTGHAHLPPEQIADAPRAARADAARQFVAEALRWLPAEPLAAPPHDGRSGRAVAAPSGGDGAASAADGEGARARVLVADDNADMRDYLTRILSAQWQVEAVGDGRAALASVRAARPDLVLADVMMPEMNGFQLLRELRADPATRSMPVVLLSARAGEESRIEGLEAGADDYLVKPFSARELMARVAARLEIGRLGRRLEVLAEEANRANRAKDEFVAVLGHELRNPLAPIMTALQVMRMGGSNLFATERAVMERQARHLVRLVDDLLDVSRISRGVVELRKERIEIAEVVARAVEMATPLFELRGHHLTADVPPRGLAVDADPFRMAQVVSNLLTNAGKYTEAGGRIAVRAWGDAGQVHLSVKDTGVGISSDMLPRVFEMFAQEPQMMDRSQGGLGLGLTIVSGLVKLHGGTVEARSEGRGRGSEFVVALPACDEREDGEGARPLPRWTPLGRPGAPSPLDDPASPNRPRRRILVVDDNEDAGAMVGEYLRELGHEVAIAGDGPEALRVAAAFSPEIALLDIGLPVMDGYELAERLRAQSPPAPLTIVAITGYGQDADRRRAAAAGFHAHLVKPVDLDALDRLLREAGGA